MNIKVSKRVLVAAVLFAILAVAHIPNSIYPHIFDKNQAPQFFVIMAIALAFGTFILIRIKEFQLHPYIVYLVYALFAAVFISTITSVAPIYSLEQYEQANARIRRLTTVGKTTVWHIWATGFEAELYRRLRAKKNTLAEFLDLVRGINSDE